MGLIDLAFDGSGSKAARINMGALLRQDLDPQPPSRASQTQQMVKSKGKNRETVRSRQSRVQVPKPTRKPRCSRKMRSCLLGPLQSRHHEDHLSFLRPNEPQNTNHHKTLQSKRFQTQAH
ncbi:unnamed protein product [Oikopleura dioica]|uniref:Uncharacterized protein n=1 Tax=Oikopleura dioica TaxID=34765 RepID=E4XPN8_OIKDI|nr:unnamed protein product [Oikopleura dioica]